MSLAGGAAGRSGADKRARAPGAAHVSNGKVFGAEMSAVEMGVISNDAARQYYKKQFVKSTA